MNRIRKSVSANMMLIGAWSTMELRRPASCLNLTISVMSLANFTTFIGRPL